MVAIVVGLGLFVFRARVAASIARSQPRMLPQEDLAVGRWVVAGAGLGFIALGVLELLQHSRS